MHEIAADHVEGRTLEQVRDGASNVNPKHEIRSFEPAQPDYPNEIQIGQKKK